MAHWMGFGWRACVEVQPDGAGRLVPPPGGDACVHYSASDAEVTATLFDRWRQAGVVVGEALPDDLPVSSGLRQRLLARRTGVHR